MAVREPVILLIRRARRAGVTVSRTAKGAVAFDIPAGAAELAAELREREQQVAALFDWRHATVAQPAPCLLCARPALLRDPADQLPAHKVCADRLLRG
jgi:hypothetical protein